MWLSHGRTIRVADPVTSAEKFPELVEAATNIINVVVEAAKKADLSTEQLKWGVKCALGGPVKVSDVISLRTWLITSGLMVDEIQLKSAAKRALNNVAVRIWDRDQGQNDNYDSLYAVDARTDAKAHPSCELLHGKALESKPIPLVTDAP
ncbi:hypothetical protein B0H16DRAFT_1483775 [Mycena metata]|uniref:Uncharacterized protein n=1 Tax=Mycena metata TaxID=1033252 RepID=A0AAD7DVC0_9AGAR|nr:hypothetical protein B0H16DRAFT_1483775 [Mycena metata]